MFLTDGKRTIELKAQGTIDGFINSGWKEVVEEVKPKEPKEKPATAPKRQSKAK